MATAQNYPALYRGLLESTLRTIDLDRVTRAIELLTDARENGRTVFVCGNGGSASTASHFVCDMVKKLLTPSIKGKVLPRDRQIKDRLRRESRRA